MREFVSVLDSCRNSSMRSPRVDFKTAADKYALFLMAGQNGEDVSGSLSSAVDVALTASSSKREVVTGLGPGVRSPPASASVASSPTTFSTFLEDFRAATASERRHPSQSRLLQLSRASEHPGAAAVPNWLGSSVRSLAGSEGPAASPPRGGLLSAAAEGSLRTSLESVSSNAGDSSAVRPKESALALEGGLAVVEALRNKHRIPVSVGRLSREQRGRDLFEGSTGGETQTSFSSRPAGGGMGPGGDGGPEESF